jgi:methyl-accepting chemotaxis protein
MATRQRIETAKEKVATAKSALDAAEKGLDVAEQATEVAGEVRSNSKKIAAIFLLLSLIGIVYLVMKNQES